jgi:hypothetical protein
MAAILTTLTIPAFGQAGSNTPQGEPLNASVKSTATAEKKGLLTDDMRPRFQAYVVQQAVPSYTYSSDIVVGAELPQQGVTYYDVPRDYGETQYRYTVVNSRPVLVDPATRRVVQVIQ